MALPCDNFEEVQIVLPSGEVVEASAQHHPDLFWALRGGGGNFGVVTRFTFRAHEFGPMMRIGIALYEPDDAAEVLREYARVAPTLPNSIGWHGSFKHEMGAKPFVPPHLVGKRLLMMFSTWLGDAQAAEGIEMVERLNGYGKPCQTATTVLPFGLGMQKMLDAEVPAGARYYVKELHMRELADEAIDRVVAFWRTMPMEGDISVASFGGVMAEQPEDAAAYANRECLHWLTFQMRWRDAADDEDFLARTRAAADSLQPWAGAGRYLNMLPDDELDRVVDGYGGPGKYARLGRIKATYDPQNMFRVNANIAPVFG